MAQPTMRAEPETHEPYPPDEDAHGLQSTTSVKASRIPFTGSSDEEEDDEADSPPVKAAQLLKRRKRQNSDPPERTIDNFQIIKPVFTSFQNEIKRGANASMPKRYESDLVWSFGMSRFLGKRHRKLGTGPSLADVDEHAIPPLLPFARLSSSQRQLLTLEDSSTVPESMNGAGSAHAALASSGTSISDTIKTIIQRRITGRTLATIPEDATTNQMSTPLVAKKREGFGFSYSDFSTSSMESVLSEVPVIKKREGYGFSYSDFGSSSDDSDDDEQCGDTKPNLLKQMRPGIITPNTSFPDHIVMRDIRRSFQYTAPFRLGCTHATLDDIIRIKRAAKKLLRFAESAKIFHSLSNRLERMVRTDVEAYTAASSVPAAKKLKTNTAAEEPKMPSVHACALRLKEVLSSQQHDRISTGESKDFVEHELQWAEWFEEASRVGVFHLKVSGCRCRPEWEDLGPEA